MTEGKVSAEARLLRESRAGRLFLYGAVAAGFVAAAILVAQTVLLSVVVDRVFLGHAGLSAVQAPLLLMFCLLVLRGGLIWAEAVVGQRSSSIYKGRLRAQLTGRLLALGPAYTAGERSGELTNTAVEGVETLDAYIAQYLPARLLAGFVPALVFLVVLVMDPVTTLVYVVAGPMLILLLALIGGRAKAMTDQRFAELSWLSAHFLDMLQGLPTLKLFGRSREQAANIETISRHYGNTTMDVLRTAFQTSLVQEWAATAATALVALEVSLRLMDHALPFTTALAVLLLTPEFFLPLRQMALKYHAGTAGKAAADRIYEVLDVPMRGVQAGEPRTPRANLPLPSRMDLDFQDVTYAYEGGLRPALRGLAFAIGEGQTVALVGATGAGKSTVANLLLRFIEPDGGSIMAGGVPLSSIEPATWRTQVAWVAQRPYLFNGTVAENIGLAKPGARPDEIVAAAAAAHADEFIRDLPRGYDTPLGEQGARLSGGQQQRLALARAFLKDAPLLILDEATVHLDAASEALVQAALRRLMRGRTALVIAHRLKLAYTADQIVVLDAGRAVEVGNHPGLLARGGLYREMVAMYEAGALPPLARAGGLA
jgi:ATP-binding cassette, subfamily C, bacterial CydD